jgi:dsRNA-specific ribonuclease
LSPGEITNWKSYVACNQFLGSLSVQLGLHKFLQHSSTALQCDIDTFALSVNNGSASNAPKVLGDLFEAIIGAIFIDSSGDIELLYEIIKCVVITPTLNPLMINSKKCDENHVNMSDHTNIKVGVEITAVSAFYVIKNLLACSYMNLLYDFAAQTGVNSDGEYNSAFDFEHHNKAAVTCKITFHDETISIGYGRNKKTAKESACTALVGINQEDRNACYQKLKISCKCTNNPANKRND